MRTKIHKGIAVISAAALVAGCSKERRSSAEIDLVPGEPEHAAPAPPLDPAGNAAVPGAVSDRSAASISWKEKPPRHGSVGMTPRAARSVKVPPAAQANHSNASARTPASAHAKRSVTAAPKRRATSVESSRRDPAVNPK